MPEMAASAEQHDAQMGPSTLETTPQRPQMSLRGASKWWGNVRKRETKGYGHYEERRNGKVMRCSLV